MHDLDALLAVLKEEGGTIVGEMESFEYGKFGWVLDREGNKLNFGNQMIVLSYKFLYFSRINKTKPVKNQTHYGSTKS